MMVSPLVSIIIPAYNAEKDIESCVKSILTQTYNNTEIIVIDDGSKDGTAQVLASLARSDGRVKYETVVNGGPASARNSGLALVSGEAKYIMFADADDTLAPDAVERAVAAAENDNSDFVIFGFTIINPDGTENIYNEPDGVYDKSTLGPVLPELYKANLLNQVWGKLYLAKIIGADVRFPPYRWGEDRLFNFDIIEQAQKISVLSYCGYNYIMHTSESLITGFYDKKPDVCVEIDSRLLQLSSSLGAGDSPVYRYMFAKSIFSCFTGMTARSCTLNKESKREYAENILQNEHIQERIKSPAGGFSTKLMCSVMATGSPGLVMAFARFTAGVSKAAPKLFQLVKHKK